MYIDFAIIKTDINETEARSLTSELLKYNVNSITAPYYLLKSFKGLISDNSKTATSCLIDYPLGVSDSKTRRFAVDQAVRLGVDFIDISMPQNLAANRKYDKIREDVKTVKSLCEENKIEPRYILEYRVFDHYCLKKICEIFDDFGIKYVYPSSGYFIDNLADNILGCIFLHQNSKDINVICSGNTWTNKHFETITKSGLFGLRTYSIHTLYNFALYNSTNKIN